MATQLDRIEDKIDRVHNAVYGNGKAGLNERVAIMESEQQADKARWKALFGIASAVLVVVFGKIIYDVVLMLK